MKFIKSLLGIAITTLLLVACKNTDSNPIAVKDQNLNQVNIKKEIVAAEKPETATFKIEGMTCEMGCAKAIEKKLTSLDGVQDAKIDFEAKTATVNFDLDKLSTDDLVKTVEDCADGKTYKVSELEIGKKV
jgi:periplasmic mercuric ion binding protein